MGGRKAPPPPPPAGAGGSTTAAPAATAAATSVPAAPPPKGSQLAHDKVSCETCHTEASIWDKDKIQFYLPKDRLMHDIHWQKGVNCQDCHGGDPNVLDKMPAHASKRPPAEVRKMCGVCHQDQAATMAKSLHGAAGRQLAAAGVPAADCVKCHDPLGHQIMPAADKASPTFAANVGKLCATATRTRPWRWSKGCTAKPATPTSRVSTRRCCAPGATVRSCIRLLPLKDRKSPVFADNQVQLCGGCHEKDLKTYLTSSHGFGLQKAGLLGTAVCATATGPTASTWRAGPPLDAQRGQRGQDLRQVPRVCRGAVGAQRARPRHGPRPDGHPGGPRRHGVGCPSCTSCHQNHSIAGANSAQFRLESPSLCGNCHPDLSSRYAMSIHGELTLPGLCAGGQVLRLPRRARYPARGRSAPRTWPANRIETCKKCHPGANANFVKFDPHANQHDPHRDPVLYWIYSGADGPADFRCSPSSASTACCGWCGARWT